MANKVQNALNKNKDLSLVWSRPQDGVYCIYNRTTGKFTVLNLKQSAIFRLCFALGLDKLAYMR